MLAALSGRFSEAERLIGQAAMLGEECGEPGARDVQHDQGWGLLTAQGRLGELGDALPAMFPDPDSVQARVARATVLLASGARAEASAVIAPVIRHGLAWEPRDNQMLVAAVYATELVIALGLAPAAEKLYAALLAFADQAVVPGVAISFKGAVARHLGLLAAALGRAAEAAARFERAIVTHEQLGAVTWAVRSRYELARLQLNDPADRDAARAALAEVAREAHRTGMTRLARDAGRAPSATCPPSASSGAFTRDGALWTLGDQAERARKAVTARTRDTTGRIEQVHPALGAHLRASVTTGTRCAYSPETPVTWHL